MAVYTPPTTAELTSRALSAMDTVLRSAPLACDATHSAAVMTADPVVARAMRAASSALLELQVAMHDAMRAAVGPWLIGREERIYRLLGGSPGVPRLICRLDRWALVVEHVEGRSCADFADGELPAEFFERLLEVVKAMHSHGVVHCDIKNRANIVVALDGKPYLLDFATAFTRGGRLNLLKRLAFERFRVDDLRGVVKARLLVGQLWNQSDAEFAFRRGPAERAIRAIRDGARWLFKQLARG